MPWRFLDFYQLVHDIVRVAVESWQARARVEQVEDPFVRCGRDLWLMEFAQPIRRAE